MKATYYPDTGHVVEEAGHRWRVDPVACMWQMETGLPKHWETMEPPPWVVTAYDAGQAGKRPAPTTPAGNHDRPAWAADDIAVIRPAHVPREQVKWLWPGRIPFGKLTVLDGDPGLGKSTVTLDVAARVTTDSPMPDGQRLGRPGGVLLLSAEDGVADTIRPRLEAAGANLHLVQVLDHVTDEGGPRPVEFPADLDRVEQYAKALLFGEELYAPRLLVVDPLMAYLGGEVNAHRDQDVRRVLHRLKLMAESTGLALVVIRHLNKVPGSNPLYRGGGSIGIIGAARAGLLVGVDPDDDGRQVLAVSKSNLAAKPPSLAYRLVSDGRYGVARVAWEGASEHSAADLLGAPTERPSPKLDEAEAILQAALEGGPRPVAWLKQHAARKRVSWDTMKRAKEALEVIVERKGEEGRRGGGSWWWRLPAGQLSIKESITDGADSAEDGESAGHEGAIKESIPKHTPDAPLNEDHEPAGQSHDSEAPAVKESITRGGGEVDLAALLARSTTLGESWRDLSEMSSEVRDRILGEERGMPDEAEALRAMSSRTLQRLDDNEAELWKLQEPHVRSWERTEGRGKRGVGQKVITTKHNPGGWRLPSSRSGYPGVHECHRIFESIMEHGHGGREDCANLVVWQLQESHHHASGRRYYCDAHLPDDYRPEAAP